MTTIDISFEYVMFNIDKLTHRNREALEKAFAVAAERSHQQVESEHFALALFPRPALHTGRVQRVGSVCRDGGDAASDE